MTADTTTPSQEAGPVVDATPPHPVIDRYYATPADRPEMVCSLFNASASAYDKITGLMCLGTGVRYRHEVLKRIGVSTGDQVLDLACGTGQVSEAAARLVGETGRVVGVDPSSEMRAVAESKRGITTHDGTAEQIPFDDNTFDYVTMGYALRHVSDLRAAFTEMNRVLIPGGTVCVLEITPPKRRLAHVFIKLYLKTIVPSATRLFSSNREAARLMSYYWDTIEQCVPAPAILDAMQAAGLSSPERSVTAGIFSEYTGTRR